MTYFSNSLGKSMKMIVVKPDDYGSEPMPCLYQLHGLSDDSTQWSRMTSIERYATENRIMVVMPDGGRSFYTNAAIGDNYEDHILETVNFVDKTFNTIKSRASRAIGGLSMGGYGSLKLGLKHTDIFSSVAAHSSVIKPFVHDYEMIKQIFGEKLMDDNDLYKLAIKNASKTNLKFDCGTEDDLIKENEDFHCFLVENNIEHVFNTYPGNHNWSYWDEHIKEAISFHVRNLKFL